MKRIVYIFHPFFEEGKDNKTNEANNMEYNFPSANNRLLVDSLKAGGFEGEYLDMYSMYPNFTFDIKKEQARMTAADEIVFIHPVYWFSIPSLMKEFIDYVLQNDWCGCMKPENNALEGKKVLQIVTSFQAGYRYSKDDFIGHTIDELFLPITRSWEFMKMDTRGILLLDNVYDAPLFKEKDTISKEDKVAKIVKEAIAVMK